jgi:hypothetical protein
MPRPASARHDEEEDRQYSTEEQRSDAPKQELILARTT